MLFFSLSFLSFTRVFDGCFIKHTVNVFFFRCSYPCGGHRQPFCLFIVCNQSDRECFVALLLLTMDGSGKHIDLVAWTVHWMIGAVFTFIYTFFLPLAWPMSNKKRSFWRWQFMSVKLVQIFQLSTKKGDFIEECVFLKNLLKLP